MRFSAILLISVCLIQSCTTPKDARQLKKSTKHWRTGPIVLSGYSDGPFAGVFLNLRENGKFEYTSSGMLMSFHAGTWTRVRDTIKLVYVDSQQNVVERQNVCIDRKTSTLIFGCDSTPVYRRLRVYGDGI